MLRENIFSLKNEGIESGTEILLATEVGLSCISLTLQFCEHSFDDQNNSGILQEDSINPT